MTDAKRMTPDSLAEAVRQLIGEAEEAGFDRETLLAELERVVQRLRKTD